MTPTKAKVWRDKMREVSDTPLPHLLPPACWNQRTVEKFIKCNKDKGLTIPVGISAQLRSELKLMAERFMVEKRRGIRRSRNCELEEVSSTAIL